MVVVLCFLLLVFSNWFEFASDDRDVIKGFRAKGSYKGGDNIGL